MKLRQIIESDATDETIATISQAVKEQNLSQLREILCRIGLERSTDVVHEDSRCIESWSAIVTHAISFGTVDMLSCILAHRFVTLHDIGSKGNTSLHLACYLGKGDMAQLLITHGASLKARDYAGRTPVDRAMEEDHLETAVEAVRQWAKRKIRKPISIACSFGYTEIIEALLRQGEAVSDDDTFEAEHKFYADHSDTDSMADDAYDPIMRWMQPMKKCQRAATRARLIRADDVLDEALTYAPAASVRLLLQAGAKIGPSHARCISTLRKEAAARASDEAIDLALGDPLPKQSSEQRQEPVTGCRKKTKYPEAAEKLEILAEFGHEIVLSSPESSLRDSPPLEPCIATTASCGAVYSTRNTGWRKSLLETFEPSTAWTTIPLDEVEPPPTEPFKFQVA
jgi:ankyrin repeat protein